MPNKLLDKEIMRAVLDALGTNAHALAQEIGASNSTVHQVTVGRNKLSAELILSIHERYPQISMKFMRSGEGNIIINPNDTQTSLSVIADELIQIRKLLEKNFPQNIN